MKNRVCYYFDNVINGIKINFSNISVIPYFGNIL